MTDSNETLVQEHCKKFIELVKTTPYMAGTDWEAYILHAAICYTFDVNRRIVAWLTALEKNVALPKVIAQARIDHQRLIDEWTRYCELLDMTCPT